jgi:cell shape-determining protein MreC
VYFIVGAFLLHVPRGHRTRSRAISSVIAIVATFRNATAARPIHRSPLRALQFVREIVDGETTVTTARLESIAHAVHTLADMTNPDRRVQVRRIDREISRLKKQRDDIKSGRTRLSTVEEQQQQLREILAMTRTLPADFRQLRTLVEDRHQRVARRAMADLRS